MLIRAYIITVEYNADINFTQNKTILILFVILILFRQYSIVILKV